jgi:hypothetical protein
MTPDEEQQLRELGSDLAGAQESAREPMCVARAFATPQAGTIALTMQSWIDLEAIRSPLLRLEAPAEAEALECAARVFALSLGGMSPEEAAHVWRAMRRAVTSAFELALPMHRPGAPARAGHDGFGAWLPLLAFLIVECGIDPISARKMRVDHAFALLAACRRNQGWECAATSYAERDALSEKTEPQHL